MKRMQYLLVLLFVCLFTSCDDTYTEEYEYRINEPVLMSADGFRSSVIITDVPAPIEKKGKICFYNGYLYISQPGEGIHIIDNRQPSNPTPIGFIELMGNADMAIRGDKLFADALIDLVWFDITNPAKPTLEGRLENVFTQGLPPMPEEVWYDEEMVRTARENNQVVIGWETVTRKETVTYHRNPGKGDLMVNESASSGSGGGGVNGSMSRFGMYDKYLYTVMHNRLDVFDISESAPVKASRPIYLGSWDVETIFSYKDCLFMGTPSGLLIYSVADPVEPKLMSAIQHVYGCDPVVVENDIAYVTIRSGNLCGQSSDELIIIDVRDVKNPVEIATHRMKNPKGLGIDNGTLFLCDDGLKVFNVNGPYPFKDPLWAKGNLLVQHKGMDGFDVIPYDNTLMMIADDGLYQYDYTNLESITQISHLKINKP